MSFRGAALIAIAVILSAGLLSVQMANGGADFVPAAPADPCQDRNRPVGTDLEALGEAIVLTGIDEAACTLGVSRERLVLALPSKTDRAELARELGTDERGLALALKNGLRTGVDRLDKSGKLPKISALLPEIADELGISQGLVDLIPDSVVDSVSTADVLRATIDKLDVNRLLADLNDSEALEASLRDAVVEGAKDAVKQRIKDALPGPLQGLID